MTASQLFFRRKEMPGSLDKGISKSVSAAHEVRYGRQYEEGFAHDRQAQDSILILAVVLLIPALISSYSRMKVNYDMLSYLPQNIDTMKGQNIMVDEFQSGRLLGDHRRGDV